MILAAERGGHASEIEIVERSLGMRSQAFNVAKSAGEVGQTVQSLLGRNRDDHVELAAFDVAPLE